MSPIFFAPWAAPVFGAASGCIAYAIRHIVLKRPKTVNYFVVFMDASAAYVLTVMICNHYFYDVKYSVMLNDGFGVEAVAFAFLYSGYHMIREICMKVVRKH